VEPKATPRGRPIKKKSSKKMKIEEDSSIEGLSCDSLASYEQKAPFPGENQPLEP